MNLKKILFTLGPALLVALSAQAEERLCGSVSVAQKMSFTSWTTHYEGTLESDQNLDLILKYTQCSPDPMGETRCSPGAPEVALLMELHPAINDEGTGLELNIFRTVDLNGRRHLPRRGVGTMLQGLGEPGSVSRTTTFQLNLQYQVFRVTLSNVRICN